jgi:hypothetical protein
MLKSIYLLKFVIILLVNSIKSNNDHFNEELFIETLPNSNLNLFFQFTTISDQNLNDESSCKSSTSRFSFI